jgi:exopolysaccharide biosynthesis polyprenyl glycosylphosphotransferase
VGQGVLAEELAQALAARDTTEVVGTLRISETKENADAGADKNIATEGGSRLTCLGAVEDLPSVVEHTGVNEVIAVLPDAAPETWRRLAEQCWRLNVSFRFVPSAGDAFFEHLSLGLVGDIPVLGVRGSRIEGVNYIFKRTFDLSVSAVLLALLSPVYLFVGLGILFSDGRPLLYFQERIGRRKRPFRMWKFRSMRRGADQLAGDHAAYLKKYIAGEASGKADARGGTVYKLTEDSRVTRFGRFIRRFSLDELPQLWNVFVGDMSLIGPRPPLPYEVQEYRPLHFRRFEAPPGISGLWQVSGRNSLSFEEMIRLDLYYLENWTLELDLRILFKTIQVVLFQRAW